MNNQISTKKRADMTAAYDADVASIVDAVLADPSRADDAKALLTRKLKEPNVVPLFVAGAASYSKTNSDDYDDDLWDNVPV